MNNIDYNQILNYFTENPIIFVLLGAIFFVILAFLISKTIRKSGLFLLLITFIIDRIIRMLPIDLYSLYPNLVFVIMGMYLLGLFFFLLKIFDRIFHSKKNQEIEEEVKKKSGLRKFFSYTGSLPLFIMLLINLINAYIQIIPRTLLSNLTSLSFLLMVFVSLINTYRYIDKKEISDDFDNMKFKDLKKDTEKSSNKESQLRNDNKDRKILKTKPTTEEKEVSSAKKEDYNKTSILKDIKYRDEVKYDFDKFSKDKANQKTKDKLTNTDLIWQVTRGFDEPMNKTILSIKNLITGESISHISENCIAKIVENEEYKVDLEFKNYNEYDYGKFLDILMVYSKDKKSYKFELELIPNESPYSKIVFFDPCEIFDSTKMFSDSFQGKNISMNFPKYKINFVTSN